MSGYFKFFPKIKYPYQGKLVGTMADQISQVECVDIMVRYRLREEILKAPLSYYTYLWKDTDRPDIVALDYYGSTDYAWLVIFSAQVFDYLYDLPMNNDQFISYLKDTYDVEDPYTLGSVIHHYEDGEGFVVDLETYTVISDSDKKIVDVFAFEQSENERRRKIKLLSRKFLQGISEEFEQTFKTLKSARRNNLGEFIMGGE